MKKSGFPSAHMYQKTLHDINCYICAVNSQTLCSCRLHITPRIDTVCPQFHNHDKLTGDVPCAVLHADNTLSSTHACIQLHNILY